MKDLVLNEQIGRSLMLMNYNRSKTLLEQPESVMDRRYNIQTPEKPSTTKSGPCDDYVSPEKCKSKFGIESICPGSKNDYEWENHCYYVSNDKETLYGVTFDDEVTFVDGLTFRKFYKALNGEDDEFLKEITTNYNKNYVENLRKTLLSEFPENNTGRTESIVNYIIEKYLPFGTIYSITSNGKTYKVKFKFYSKPMKPVSGYGMSPSEIQNYAENNFPKTYLEPVGYFSDNDEEYETPDSGDLRSGFDRFIDDWGTTIQIAGAIGFAVAGAFTGGAAWALAGELIVELGLASALAYRALEEENSWGAGMELLFGMLPFLKLSKQFAGISDEVFQSLGSKWSQISNAKNMTQKQLGEFWVSLTDEEAEAFAKIIRQEDVILRQFAGDTREAFEVVREAMKLVDSTDEAKRVITKFASSSAGKELKLTGVLLGLDLLKSTYLPFNDEQIKTIESILSAAQESQYGEIMNTLLNLDDKSPENMMNTVQERYGVEVKKITPLN